MMLKRIMAVLCVIVISLSFTACYDAIEINGYAYVSMMGLDVGVNDKMRITFNIPRFPEEGKGTQQHDDQTEMENITIDTSSLLSGVALINSSIPKILNFMHLKAIVISEELASSGNLADYLAPLVRYRQLRRNTYIFICKGSAQELIMNSKPYLDAIITESIEELVGRSEYTGLFPKMTLGTLYNSIKSPYQQLLATYAAVNNGENLIEDGPPYEGEYQIPGDVYAGDTTKKGGQKVELLGSAVFDGDKMVGKLTGFETQMVLLVRNQLRRAVFTIEDPEKPGLHIPIECKEFTKPKIRIDLQGEKPMIQIDINIEGELPAIQSRINYEEPQKKEIVEKVFADYVKTGLERTFTKCKALKSDVFDFGSVAVSQFLTIQQWEKFNWIKKFADAELKTNVNFTIRRTGKLQKSVPVISSEGKE